MDAEDVGSHVMLGMERRSAVKDTEVWDLFGEGQFSREEWRNEKRRKG